MRQMLRPALLEDLLRVEAPGGFLTVYAGADPTDPDRARIEFKTERARVEAEHDGQGSSAAVHEALEAIDAGVEETLQGNGAVAGFVPIGADGMEAIWMDAPGVESTTLVHDASPYALPLLSTVEQFGVCGVVTVAGDQIAVHEWRNGRLEELDHRSVDVDTGAWRDSDGSFNAANTGRSGVGGVGAMSTVGSDDSYSRKLEDATVAQLANVGAPLIAHRTEDRGWRRLVWFGASAIVDTLRSSMGDSGLVHVVGDDVQLLRGSPGDLLERVVETNEATWTTDSRAAVESMAERAPAGRVDSVEEAGTLAREGRIDQLYVTVPNAHVDDYRRQINALLGAAVRHGGSVRALRATGSECPTVVASLRW